MFKPIDVIMNILLSAKGFISTETVTIESGVLYFLDSDCVDFMDHKMEDICGRIGVCCYIIS